MISTGRIVKKSLLAKALLATLVAPIHAASDAGDNEVAELRSLVTELQRQVAQLQGESNQQWLTEQRAQEIRGLVQDVLADADTRASLLQSDAMAGWEPGRGFFIGSADGNYLLRFSGQIQIRAVYNRQEESPSDDSRFGFEARRVKIYFAGHVFDPSWQYEIELQNQRSGGAMELGENGWIQKDFGNGWTLRGGQLKPAYSREDSVSSRRLQSVERTLINTQFSAGTTQGLQVRYAADQWRVFASVHDGVRTANTSWSTQDTEYAMGGRAELLLMGDWKQMEHDIGFRDGEQSLLVGGAVHYERDEFGTALGPPPELLTTEEDTVGLTSDVTWKCQGGSIAAALYYRMRDADDAGLDVDQYGFFIRGGLFVMDDLELYAQYEWGDLDVDAIEELQVITLGVNKYWDKHNLKWQSDLGFAFDEVSSAWASDSSGWRADAPGEDGQIVVRTQVQLLF